MRVAHECVGAVGDVPPWQTHAHIGDTGNASGLAQWMLHNTPPGYVNSPSSAAECGSAGVHDVRIVLQ